MVNRFDQGTYHFPWYRFLCSSILLLPRLYYLSYAFCRLLNRVSCCHSLHAPYVKKDIDVTFNENVLLNRIAPAKHSPYSLLVFIMYKYTLESNVKKARLVMDLRPLYYSTKQLSSRTHRRYDALLRTPTKTRSRTD
jgi:hypothetical protein